VNDPRNDEIAWAAQMACLFEVDSHKPGNVSPSAGFSDARFEDFVVSAFAIGPAFSDVVATTVGETVLRAVSDTRRFVSTNTNLGIVLLLAPLAKAAGLRDDDEGYRAAVARVLAGLTVEDARRVYAAIRLAAPAGLGEVDTSDVRAEVVTTTLREAMALAEQRDSVAREYVTDFEITFEVGFESLRRTWGEGHSFVDCVVQTFLVILARVPDTLIARKMGLSVAEGVSMRAHEVLAAGGCLSRRGRAALLRFDHDLRDGEHRLNPGTTADLVTAALFVFLTERGMLDLVPDLLARH
jgi:triphosphoribosyl-dephospho-CoA synthase